MTETGRQTDETLCYQYSLLEALRRHKHVGSQGREFPTSRALLGPLQLLAEATLTGFFCISWFLRFLVSKYPSRDHRRRSQLDSAIQSFSRRSGEIYTVSTGLFLAIFSLLSYTASIIPFCPHSHAHGSAFTQFANHPSLHKYPAPNVLQPSWPTLPTLFASLDIGQLHSYVGVEPVLGLLGT